MEGLIELVILVGIGLVWLVKVLGKIPRTTSREEPGERPAAPTATQPQPPASLEEVRRFFQEVKRKQQAQEAAARQAAAPRRPARPVRVAEPPGDEEGNEGPTQRLAEHVAATTLGQLDEGRGREMVGTQRRVLEEVLHQKGLSPAAQAVVAMTVLGPPPAVVPGGSLYWDL